MAAARFRQPDLDAAVLRQPLFRDAHVGHDLDAADERGLQLLGRIGHDLQHAVDAVAQAQPLLQRLEMNIARAHPVRLEDHEIDQADDVGVVHLAPGASSSLAFPDDQVVRAIADQAADHVGGAAVVALDRGMDFLGRRHDRIDLETQFLAQRVDRVEVERIGQRDAQMVALDRQRHDAEAMDQRARHGGDRLLRHALDVLDHIEAGLGRRGPQDVEGCDTSRPHQFLDGTVAVLAGGAPGVLHVGGFDQAMLDQEFQNIIVVGGHRVPARCYIVTM